MNRHRDRERDRRREARVTGTGLRARVRPGHRLVIIDLSSCGALVEAGRPLRPGSYVDVQLETEARRGSVAARVVRCAVVAIDSQSGVTYRAALSFSETCEWVREGLTPAGYAFPGSTSGAVPDSAASGEQLPAAPPEDARAQMRGTK
jgi:hypothetical protein